jgi:hypothetical protein
MSDFSQPPEKTEVSAVDRVALLCAVVSVVCVLGAHALDKLAQSGAPPRGAATAPRVDYTPTGSIPNAAAPRVDPCGGKTPAH